MSHQVSIILSVRNGENYLQEAIESVLDQTYQNKEILVVNDGSTDRTEQILQKFEGKIQFFYQEHKGLGAGRNRGIQAAKGNYYAFLDHDDLWMRDKLTWQMDVMKREKEVDPLIFSHLQQFICSSLTEEEKKKLLVDESILPGYLAGTLLISKTRFHQIGFFTEKIEVGEFIEWYLRAQEARVPVKMIPEVTLRRRVHKENMGRRKDLYQQNAYLHILKAALSRKRTVKTL